MTDADPFGRAVRDHHFGDRNEPLLDRAGGETREHPIERFYFGEFDPESEAGRWLASRLDGPLADLGAGVGRHARYFQRQFETVAVEVSGHLVETMRDRGVRDARRADMFALRKAFDRDRFRSALSIGTQAALAGSMAGLRRFLGDLAHVTTVDGTAVIDCYDPEADRAPELFGFRSDPTPGLAYRLFRSEYEGDAGEALLFRLFSPDRLREAALCTGWTVAEVRYGPEEGAAHYRAALEKR